MWHVVFSGVNWSENVWPHFKWNIIDDLSILISSKFDIHVICS